MPRKRRNAAVSCDISIQQDCGAGSRSESPTQAPPQRNAANARERARMRVLSKAFCRLKTTLPWVPADTKLSKLDTLRLATSYIAHLKAALTTDHQDDLAEHINGSHPLNLTWPFTFQHCSGLSHHTVPLCRPRGDSDCSGLSPISDVGATCMDHTDDGRNGGQEFEEFMYNDNYTNSGWHHHHR